MRLCLLRFPFLLIVLLGLILSSCEKDEIIIDDNTAPPDHTVPTLVLETYINKCYISLLGRKPSPQEESEALALLIDGQFNKQSRETMLSPLLQSGEYRSKLLETQCLRLLNQPYDHESVGLWVGIFNNLINDPEYAFMLDMLYYERDRMELLEETPSLMASGQMGMSELHRRFCDNYFYDQINMGSLNLVVSLYNHFLYRAPTEAELESSIAMVDGLASVAFYTNGASKDDFITIFFDSNDYHEGAVRELFLRYLFREPTSAELNQYTVVYKASDDYEDLQKRILSLDEFAGL